MQVDRDSGSKESPKAKRVKSEASSSTQQPKLKSNPLQIRSRVRLSDPAYSKARSRLSLLILEE